MQQMKNKKPQTLEMIPIGANIVVVPIKTTQYLHHLIKQNPTAIKEQCTNNTQRKLNIPYTQYEELHQLSSNTMHCHSKSL